MAAENHRQGGHQRAPAATQEVLHRPTGCRARLRCRHPAQRSGQREIVTIWDGVTTKPHPITGKEVPDETARKAVFDYTNPKRAEWPSADVIVGNPPFIGASRMRDALGDGYTETLRKAWKGLVPESADFVMYWWEKAAELVRDGKTKRFGFITTNSIHQTFNRRVIEPFYKREKAAAPQLRHRRSSVGRFRRWCRCPHRPHRRRARQSRGHPRKSHRRDRPRRRRERSDPHEEGGPYPPNLQIGADLNSSIALTANAKLAHRGVQTIGAGFIVSPDEAKALGSGTNAEIGKRIRGYRNGRDLTDKPRGVKVIDLFGLTADEAQAQWPLLYQHVLIHVKPERDQNNRDSYRQKWWIHGEPRKDLRPALAGLPRYIATVETSKHRFFTFLEQEILPDNKLIAIASDDAYVMGILSSAIHVNWSLATGSWLGVGNDSVYAKSRCFEPFPFPALEESPLKQRIRDLGERLDAHRKTQQALHPDLTLTGMYNVLEAVRAGTPLTAKEKAIHDKGLVSILQQIHDELDAAVFEAYGWSDLAERDANKEAPHSCGARAKDRR